MAPKYKHEIDSGIEMAVFRTLAGYAPKQISKPQI